MPTDPPSPARRWALPLLLALTALAYAGVGQAGFVWDDEGLILLNERLRDGSSPLSFFTTDLWDGTPAGEGVSGYYRPLMLLSLYLDRQLFGLSPAGYHLHSLLWHLLAVFALAGTLRPRLGAGPALMAAAVFALHPKQSEAVVWVAARNDPMAAALAFSALWALSGSTVGRRRLLLAAVLALGAMLAKESVVLLPLLLGLLDLGSGQRPQPARYLALGLGIGVGIAMRLLAGVHGAGLPELSGWMLLARNGLELLGTWGADLLIGWPLSASRSLEWLYQEPPWRVGLGLVGWLLLFWGALRRGRLALAGLLWLLLTLLPVLVPIADKGGIGERFTYLPMAGLGIWLAAVLPERARGLLALLAVPALLLIHGRLPQWQGDRPLWEHDHAVLGSPYTKTGLAMTLLRDGEEHRALGLLVEALDQDPPSREGCDRLVTAAAELLPPVQAEAAGRFALSRGCPRTGELAGSLAATQAGLGQWDRAARTLDGAPLDPMGRDRVVRAVVARRDGDEAAFAELLAESVDPLELERKVEELLGSSAGP